MQLVQYKLPVQAVHQAQCWQCMHSLQAVHCQQPAQSVHSVHSLQPRQPTQSAQYLHPMQRLQPVASISAACACAWAMLTWLTPMLPAAVGAVV